ncbi:MAG: AAA family ATPase [Gammaproteobacteria bacterium]|nr:AAA family ATPase [Gammaproteobacteria bacterium]
MAHDPYVPADGLAQRPQQAFFREPVRLQRLSLLHHLTPYGGLFLVYGDRHSGKTTLLQQFVLGYSEKGQVCCVQAEPAQSVGAFLQQLVRGYGLEVRDDEDTESFLAALVDQLRSWKEGGEAPVLVIDDAHLLQDDCLFLLMKLLRDGYSNERMLGVVLFAERELERRLARPELRLVHANITHGFDVPALSDEDIRRYIQFRMEGQAGGQGVRRLSSSVGKFIQVASRGLPGKIDELLDTALRLRRERRRDPEPAVVQPAHSAPPVQRSSTTGHGLLGNRVKPLHVAVIGSALIISLLVFRHDITGLLGGDPLMTWMRHVNTAPDTAAEAPATLDEEQDTIAARETDEEIPSATPPAPAPSSVPSVAGAASTARRQPPSPVSVPPQLAREESKPVVATTTQLPAAVLLAQRQDAAAGHESVAAQPDGGDTVSLGRIAADEEWLATRPTGRFTLQLLAADTAAVADFISRHDLDEQVRYYRARSIQGEVLGVVYGDYASRAEAQAALSTLGTGVLSGIKPLSRDFVEVRAALQLASDERQRSAQDTGQLLAQGERWLLERSPRHYTLQLLAMEGAALEDFISQSGFGSRVQYYRTAARGERSLVAAIYGDYASKEDAEKDARALLQRLPGARPWARQFSSIQDVIISRQPAEAPPQPADN